MSIPSLETDNTSSTIIDDDMSIVANDSSDTTVATQTSASWHSVVSDVQINNNLFLRSHSINTWVKTCFIEPDIRLTTAQEWKLRTCIRRLISLCNLPLKISCIKTEESMTFIDQNEQSLTLFDLTQISQAWRHQNQTVRPQSQLFDSHLEQLGLYLHILPITTMNNELLEVKLFEFYSKNSQNKTILHIPLLKSPKFVFHISLNILQLSLRCANSLLELRFLTREHEPIRGNYYKWNEITNEHIKFNITVDIDQSLINELNTI